MNFMPEHFSRKGERGNVLFLILIAVALFAALSYAVTQSTRSGSGDASGETNLIGSAQLAQYPAGVRTSLVRMVIAGVGADQLAFNQPSEFAALGANTNFGVFHPQGGGAVFAKGPADIMVSGGQENWIFSSDFEIEQVGVSDVGASAVGNDIIAFLPGVTANICRKINEELGINVSTDGDSDAVPPSGAAVVPDFTTNSMTSANPGIGADVAQIGGDFIGQPFGCYDSNDGNADPVAAPLVYYHVLIER